MEIVLTLHSLVRWLILLVAVVAIVKFALGWLQQREFRPMDRGLMAGFTGLIDLQFVLGLILLVAIGTYTRHQLEHAFTMIVVLLLVHLLPRRWRESPDAVRFRNQLLLIVGSLVLLLLGIVVLPGDRWTFP